MQTFSEHERFQEAVGRRLTAGHVDPELAAEIAAGLGDEFR